MTSASILVFSLFLLSGCNQKTSVYDAIRKAYVEYDYNSRTVNADAPKQEKMDYSKINLAKYLGVNNGIYAFCLGPKDEYNLTGYVYLEPIKIDGYVSKSYYDYTLKHNPLVYVNNSIRSVEDAYESKLIDLDFIKTFDEFQKVHAPEELKDIYI